jgi:hypothetical protein
MAGEITTTYITICGLLSIHGEQKVSGVSESLLLSMYSKLKNSFLTEFVGY